MRNGHASQCYSVSAPVLVACDNVAEPPAQQAIGGTADPCGNATSFFLPGLQELAECPGLGPIKIRRLQEAFREPFRRSLAPGAGTGSAAAQTASPPASAATGQDSDSGSDESL